MEYTFVFNKDNPYWDSDRNYNMMFLKSRETYFNGKLRLYGKVYLFQVLKELGVPYDNVSKDLAWDIRNNTYVAFIINENNDDQDINVTISEFSYC
jgi:hypothetical protein